MEGTQEGRGNGEWKVWRENMRKAKGRQGSCKSQGGRERHRRD